MPQLNLQHSLRLLLSFILLYCFSQCVSAQQLAFPSAYGAGAESTGGRGGTVVHVTNLNADGVGSFKWALQADENQYPSRIIVFDVSGVINLNGNIRMSNAPGDGGNYTGNITIAGQTAPEGGITITGGKLILLYIDNVVIRYLKLRGTGDYDGVFSFSKGSNSIIDHLSVSHARTEIAITMGTTNDTSIEGKYTIQNCLISQSKSGVIAGNTAYESPQFSSISILRNAYYNVSQRTPLKGGGAFDFDVINNITHNWQNRLTRMDGRVYNLNHIGNYYQSGINSSNTLQHCSYLQDGIEIYNEDNFLSENKKPSGYDTDESAVWTQFQLNFVPLPSAYFVNTAHPIKGRIIPIVPSSEVKETVLPLVGASQFLKDDGTVGFYRDPYDIEHADGVLNDSNATRISIISSVSSISNTRPGNFYVSNPHIPEVWFSANVPAGQDHNDISPNGYTWLEEYLNLVDGPLVLIGAESVAVTPDTATLNVPETITLSTTFTPANTSDQSGVWTSSDANIATVSSNGTVTSIAEGDVTITFTSNDGGFSDSSDITVTNITIDVESLAVSPNTLALDLGETIQANVDFIPANATNQNGTWSSSNPSVANVDANGNIIGIVEGEATISFTSSENASLSDDILVTVEDVFFGTYEFYNADTDQLIQLIEGDSSFDLNTIGNQVNFRCIPQGGDTNSAVESIQVEWSGIETGQITESVPIYTGMNHHNGFDFDPYTVIEGTYNFTVIYYSEDSAAGDIVAIDNFSLTFLLDTTPVANAGIDQSICEGETITLTATGGTNFLWNTGETNASIDVTPTQTTTYTVTVSNDEGDEDTDDVIVTVNNVPVADAGEDQLICQGESITLTATGGNSYLWSTGETTASIEISPASETIYSVEVTSNNCSSTDSVIVSVSNAPDITVSDAIVIVEGESTTLVASGSDNYSWSTGETTASIIVTPTVTTTYTVSSTSANSCPSSVDVTVTVIPEVIADAGADTNICRDDTVTLNATGGGTYLWSTGETTAQIVVTPLVTTIYTVTVEDSFGYTDADSVTITVNETPDITVSEDIVILDGDSTTLSASGADNYQWNTGETTATITVTPLITTTYTVISTAAGGCAAFEQVTVTVIPEVIADAGQDATICSGETITLSASGGTNYIWNTGETTPNLTVNPIVTTTYIVTVEDAYGFTDTDSVTITVNATPDITVSEAIVIMDGDSATLTANGGDNYQWNTGDTTASIIVSPNVTTTYTVTSVGAGSCEDIEQVTVTVIPELNADAGSDAAICSGESITLNASGGISYTWNTGDLGSQLEVSPTVTTTYSVTVEDGLGNSDTDSVTITVNEIPNIFVSDDVSIMDGDSTTLNASGGDNYQWNTGDTMASIIVSPNVTTTYTVTSVGAGSCEDIEQVTVTVTPELIADAGSDAAICSGESITLNASGGISYTWNTGDLGSQLEVSPIVTTTYSVTVEDGLGNSDTDSVTITVNETPNIFVSDDVSIMDGNTTTLTANGGDNYQWNTGETTASIIVSPNVTTTYTVTSTGLGDCEDIEQVTVTVIPELIADAGSDAAICSGESITLNASGGISYTWNTGDLGSQLEVSPTVTTIYSVTVEDGFGNSDTDSVTVVVNDIPNITVSQNITIVEGQSTDLVVSGAQTYQWNTGETSNSISVSPTQTTTYTVIATANTCSIQAQVTVTVEDVFEASAGEDERVCQNDNYEVVLTANQGDSYLWNTGETTQSITVSPSSTSTYSVTVTQGEQDDTDNVTVFVDPNPNVVISNGNSIEIMSGDFVTLSASGANSYEWDNGATQPNIAVSPPVTTIYQVKGYIGNCYDEKQITVNVIPEVIADAGDDVTICLNEFALLTASGGDEYVWNTGETTQTIEVSPLVTTAYTVTVFNAVDFDEDTVNVQVDTDCNEDPIDDASQDFDFDIFPNPASNVVKVKLSGSDLLTNVYLYDMTGKLIYSARISNENSNNSSITRINVSNLEAGMYYIKLVDINRELTKKLIVK